MSLTTDEDLLFQADQDLERREVRQGKLQRLADKGQPVKLSTKALDLLVRGNDAWTAESGFIARRTDLQVRGVRSRAQLSADSTDRLDHRALSRTYGASDLSRPASAGKRSTRPAHWLVGQVGAHLGHVGASL